MSRGTQLSGVTASNRRRTSDVFTPRAPSSTAAASGGWGVSIWASTCWAVTWSLRRGHAQGAFDRGILQQGEQDVIGASSAITPATSLLTCLQIDGPRVMH